MKGTVSATIPERQYENIRVDYEFNNEKEKDEAYEQVIRDCLKYRHEVSRRAAKLTETPPEFKNGETTIINGTTWTVVNGKWVYESK